MLMNGSVAIVTGGEANGVKADVTSEAYTAEFLDETGEFLLRGIAK